MIAGFGLGVRFAWSRQGGVTTGLAVVAGFLIVLLLGLAIAVPAGISGPDQRESKRSPVESPDAALVPFDGSDGMLVGFRETIWQGRPISVLQVTDPSEVPPPGVDRLPGPGESVVSPALHEILQHASDLSTRIPSPAGVIAEDVLTTPDELFAYVGVTEETLRGSSSAAQTYGWGRAEPVAVGEEIPSIVSVPLAALVLAPTGTLLAAVLRMDLRRRERRQAALSLLGASRSQLVAADAGVVVPPLLVGWLAAAVARPWLMDVVAEQVFGGRVVSGSDLLPGVGGELTALVFLVVLALAVALAERPGGRELRRLAGAGHTAVLRPLALGTLLLGSGTLGAYASIRDPYALPASVILGSAVLLLIGAIVVLGPVTITIGRSVARSSLAGELALIRLRTPRSGWHTTTSGLLLAGAVVGVALTVLQMFDAATTDEVGWQPEQVPPATAFAFLAVTELRGATASGRFSHVLPVVPTGATADVGPADEVAGSETTDGDRDLTVVLVACPDARRLVEVPGRSCDWVAAFDQSVEAGRAVRIEDATGRQLKQTSIVAGKALVPARLIGDSTTLLVPVASGQIRRALGTEAGRQSIGDSSRAAVSVVLADASTEDVAWLRNETWHSAHDTFSGSSGPLSNVVSRRDLLIDGRHYQDIYSSLLLGAVSAGLVAALLTTAIGSAAYAREQYARNALLDTLGAPERLIRSAHLLSDLIPLAVSGVLATGVGVGLGLLYRTFDTQSSLGERVYEFPFTTFLPYILAAVTLFTVITLLAGLATRLTTGRQSAVVLRQLRGD